MLPRGEVVHLSRESALRRVADRLSREQRSELDQFYKRKNAIVLTVEAEEGSGDLVFEVIPKWVVTWRNTVGRTGHSYQRRTHTDGSWHLWGQGSGDHLPSNCDRCRQRPDMLEPIGHCAEIIARPELTKEELDAYWTVLLDPSGQPTCQITDLPVEGGSSEGYEYWGERARRVAVKREQALVVDFCSYLKRSNRRFTSRSISLGSTSIRCDVFDHTKQILFEAKADASNRAQIRMAIGQLFDYGYFGFESRGATSLRKAVLLPSKPSDDILELLKHVGLGVAWQVSNADFKESHPVE